MQARQALQTTAGESAVPLCVDLDGTLIRSNSLYELLAQLIRLKPLYVFIAPFWLMRGQAVLWQKIVERMQPVVYCLPYREAVLSWLQKEQGLRPLVLVTGAHQRAAEAVAAHLGLFDAVLGSSRYVRLTSHRKSAALVERFGEGGFDYLGDSRQDLPVWRKSRRSYCVTPNSALRSRIARMKLDVQYLDGSTRVPSLVHIIVRLLRVHQWLKNVLVFAPVVLSHNVSSLSTLGDAAIAFAAFSCCASATYIINDLLDLEADRQHAVKRNRPLASALISIPTAVLISIFLLVCATGLTAMLTSETVLILGVYFATTVAYSMWLKKVVLVDAFVLATLYSLRVLGGGAATGVIVSAWTLAFFMFLFLSLALLKRYAEMAKMSAGGANDKVRGRGYHRADINFVSQCGVASGLVSVLVFALYLHSPEVHLLYERPNLLWFLSPILAYGTLSMWLSGHRGEMDQDPILFAAKSPTTYLLGAIGFVVILAASI